MGHCLANFPIIPYLIQATLYSPITMMLLVEGFLLSVTGVLLMLLFEFGLSMDDVEKFRSRDGGKELYRNGMIATIFNHLVFGPITYYLTMIVCLDDDDHSRSLWQHQLYSVIAFLVIQSGLYFCIHYAMHTRPLYWMHRFHHKFNSIVLPSSASAVSPAEFIVAYMMPFIIAAKLSSCDKPSAVVSVLCVMTANLYIHTPALEELLTKRLPWMFVSPSDHLAHHRQLSCHYSAPIFHYDRVIETLKEATSFHDTNGSKDD